MYQCLFRVELIAFDNQPRALVPVGVHRDKRHHNANLKCYAATYNEAITNSETIRFNGGRYLRRCTIRYYPSDRTATVEDVKQKGDSSTSHDLLPARMQRERNLCQKAKKPRVCFIERSNGIK